MSLPCKTCHPNNEAEEELGKCQELGGMMHDWSQVNQVGNEEQKLEE